MPQPRAHRTPRRGSILWWVLGILALGGMLAGLVATLGKREQAHGGPQSADRAPAAILSFDVSTSATGELEARERIEIRSPLDQDSTIIQIAPEGSWASKGDLLIQLNADPILQKIDDEALRLRTEQAELGTAQTQYNIQEKDNEAKVRQAELKVSLAQLALQQWREGDVKKKRQDLELNIDKATLELDRLAQRYLRSQELFDEDFVSKDERDRDEVAYIEAISAYTTALLARDVYEQYELVMQEKNKLSDLEEALAELERVKLTNANELANRLTRLEAQRERTSIVEKRLEKLRKDQAAATLRAPSDGLIVYATSMERGGFGRGGDNTPLQIGQQVYPNQLLMILPNTTEMIAAVRVSESLAGKVRPGQSALVRVDAAGGQSFAGCVESIGVMAETGGWRDPNLREYTVRIALQQSTTPLKPAMRCEASIILDRAADALAVPVQSVFSDGPIHFVYTPRGASFVRTPVKLGRRSDSKAEILAGLKPGDVVLIREPSPGEILAQPWAPDALKALGYALDDDGRPIPNTPPPNPDLVPAQPAASQPNSPGRANPSGESRPGGGNRQPGQRPPGGSGGGGQPRRNN